MVDISLLGLTAALLAGTISFLSPCVLPLVPGYVSYVAGRTDDKGGAAAALAVTRRLAEPVFCPRLLHHLYRAWRVSDGNGSGPASVAV